MSRNTVITTITSAAASRDLVALADVKMELDIEGRALDPLLKKYISRASQSAENFCNRAFVVETLTDEFWPERDPAPRVVDVGLEPLQLSRYPITNVGSVTANGIALVEDADFAVDFDKGQLTRLSVNGLQRPWVALPTVVSYSAGFAIIPDDLQDAVTRLVKAAWFARKRDPMLRQSNAVGIYEEAFFFGSGPGAVGNMPPDVAGILNNYRVPVTAAA
jgi:hypothetical protein